MDARKRMTITRDQHYATATCGIVVADGELFFSLELPWAENTKNISCIPTGEYECEFVAKTPHFENVFRVKNVEGRDNVLIHNGNYPRDSKGCILIGMGRNSNGHDPMVVNSRMALGKLIEIMGKEPFTLCISDIVHGAYA